MFTQNKLAEVGSCVVGGLFVGWLINNFLLGGFLDVHLVSNTVAVVLGGVGGGIFGFLPKGN